VFDIGANLGDKAEWFANRGVRVVAVEPQPALVQRLRERFTGNPLVKIVPKGLSFEPGILPMSINTKNHVISTFSAEWKTGRFSGETWDQQVDVEVTTFDELIREFGAPRYAKIDVEGFERHVLLGLHRKISCLSYEYTSERLDHAREINENLTNLGFQYFNFSIAERPDFYFPGGWRTASAVIGAIEEQMKIDPLTWGDIYSA
jgi:FkbM family methyltransferase